MSASHLGPVSVGRDRLSREEIRACLTWSGTRLARAIRDGERTSEEIVEAHIAHLERVNPKINAVVCSRLDRAREEARAIDAAVRSGGTKGPFAGVPCTIKESFQVESMPNSAGLVSRKHIVSLAHGVTVSRVFATGAIPLGVTNISELLMWLESHNHVYGRCRNPYDLGRIAGGSSGGEGAAVGAGIAPFGLGSDIGGSIRLPAFFNGVFGHKPSSGLVPNAGQWPTPTGDTLRLLCTGPLARRAEDLWPLLKALAGPEHTPPTESSPDAGEILRDEPAGVSIEGMRVLQVETNGLNPVHPELRRAQARAAEHLRARGAKVETVSIPELRYSGLMWSARMTDGGDFAHMLFDGQKKRVAIELLRAAAGIGDHTLPALALAAVEGLPKLLPGNTRRWQQRTQRFIDEMADRVGDGVMLYPTYTRPAPRHNMPMLTPTDWTYTAVINALEMPSTQVPLGLGSEGLPLGCQVIGRHGQDHRTIAVALELERAFGGWVPPALHAA